MKGQRQPLPNPVLSPPSAQHQANGHGAALAQSMQANVPPQPPAPLRPLVVTASDQIELRNPTIRLPRHVWIGTKESDQVNTLTPKRAVIIGSAIVIEELKLILPLEGAVIHIGEPTERTSDVAR